MKIAKLLTTTILFLAMAYTGLEIIRHSKVGQGLKTEYAELNHFKYGLFNVDAWKAQLSTIISEEIDKLYLNRRTENTLKSHLEKQLEILIDKINERIKKKNNETAQGRFKQSLMDSFVDVEDIKEGIPEYAKAILAEMSSPQTEGQIKKLLKERISSYMKDTYDTRPLTLKEQIMKNAGDLDEEAAKKYIGDKIEAERKTVNYLALILVTLASVIFLMELFGRDPLPQPQYFLMTLALVVLLIVGVTTPMIDMEAKISQFNFVLFDHPIKFENQVLYFQSKSVLDVFQVMITHKELQMNLVGILIVGFSVIFPIIKIISSMAFYYDFFQARKYKLIQFFVLKSGKWSMADVLVVAIFMAYIGFNGIINSQLGQMGAYTDSVDLMTTNGTNLQPGFYIFFSYTILAMFLSGILHKRPHKA